MILVHFPEEILNHSNHSILNIYLYFLQLNNHASKSRYLQCAHEGKNSIFVHTGVPLCDRAPLMTRSTKDQLEFNRHL